MHYNTNFSQGKEDLSNRYIIIEDLLTFVRVYDTFDCIESHFTVDGYSIR